MRRSMLFLWLIVVAAMLTACSNKYHLRQADMTPNPAWPYQRNTVAATGSREEATFSGRLNLLWTASVSGRPAGPLAIYNNTLVLPETKNKIRFYDRQTGKQAGKLRTRGVPQTGLVMADALGFFAIGPTRNILKCYDLTRHKQLWHRDLTDALPGPILVNSRLLVGSSEGRLCAYTLEDGKCDWRFEPGRRLSAAASFGFGKVYQPADRGMLYVLSPDDGRELYHVQLPGPIVSSVAIGELVFVTDVLGHVYALSPDDGRVIWETNLDAPIWTSAAIAHGRVFVGNSGGEVVALDARDGRVIWRHQTREVIRASPLVVGACVVVGTMGGTVVLLRADDGTVIESTRVNGAVACSPITDGQRVFVATEKGKILCFGENYEPLNNADQGVPAQH
jgi:outer membrane protein assembly factor BamB